MNFNFSEQKNKILVNAVRLKDLFKRMVDIYSPSGKEKEITAFVYNYLKRYALPARRQKVDMDRENVIVFPGGQISLLFMGHLDTITAPDIEEFRFHESYPDLIRGLGTADMKGGCAAMIEAYITLWENGYIDLPIALALVVGEEENGDGSEKLLEEWHAPEAVVGEPTGLNPCFSHYGYIEVQLTTQGTQKHASLARTEDSAVESMLHLLLALVDHLRVKRSDVVYNIRDLSSSQPGFVVPESCQAWVDLHLPPKSPVGEIAVELEEVVEQIQEQRPETDSEIKTTTLHSGYELPLRGELYENLMSIYNNMDLPLEFHAFPSHSDANFLFQEGIRPVILGPGDLEKAHGSEESINFNQVIRASQIYCELMLQAGQKK